MGIQLQLILTIAHFVISGWTLVQLHDPSADQAIINDANDAGRTHENTFNKMNEELRSAQYRNANKKRNLHTESIAGKDNVMVKREIDEEENTKSTKTRSTKSVKSTKSAKSVKSTKSAKSTKTKKSTTRYTTFEPTKDTKVPMRWYTLPSPERTPSTESWDEALGFDKIEVVEPRIDPTRDFVEDKYYCERDDKKIRKGHYYFDHENCLFWHCPKWPIPVGVYDFVYYNCTEIDVRVLPLYHKECRVHRCRTKRINLEEPIIFPTVPAEYRTAQTLINHTVFSESGEWR